MIGIIRFRWLLIVCFILSSMVMLTAGPTPAQAQDVVVSAAAPDNAPQGSINLSVQVKGNGFKKGALAKWLVTGSETDTGGVTVLSTAYVSPSELRATVNVAANAQTDKKFDIKVTLSSGRTGKGIELFKVLYNPPDPAIAYHMGSVFNGDLMVMNADGTNITALIKEDNEFEYSYPSWSPDGSQLAFIRDNGSYLGWLYVVDKDGSNPREVTPLNSYWPTAPQWSPAPAPDGLYKILLMDQLPNAGQHDLLLINTDGTGLVNLTSSTVLDEWFPSWNPSATRIVAEVNGGTIQDDILVFDVGWVDGVLTATPSINLTESGPLKDANVTDPSWAKTQDRILISAFLPGESFWSLWIIDLADPASPTRVPQVYSGNPLMATWSPDDSKIVYRRVAPKGSKEKSGIFVVNADGS